MKIIVINGPNIQLLGIRKTEVYGTRTLKEIEQNLSLTAASLKVDINFFQSNHEGDIADRIATALAENIDGIIINPAAYTHTSIAIHDALEAAQIPAIEVHISNIHRREEFRKHSMTVAACLGQISGLGIDGYEWALRALVKHINTNSHSR